jgi:hypothetical protein
MHDFWMSFAKWAQASPWGTGVRTSLYVYPLVQATHFSGLSLWVGTNVALDLRLMGFGKKHCTPAELRDRLFVWNWIGFGVAILGGFLLFSSTAMRYIVNPSFQIKLGILVPTALLWHIFVQRKARTWGETDTSAGVRLAGFLELLLWLSVVSAAVLIPTFEN